MSIFTEDQIEHLLMGLAKSRVKADPRGMAYLEQHDVRAHMNRVFGFGGWSHYVTSGPSLVFEEPAKAQGKWDVCYRASVRLTVRGEDGSCEYEDSATGFAQNQSRGAGHDLALKSAVSTALKRAATSLGDQFGLSLYAGTIDPIVRVVVGRPEPAPADVIDNMEGRGQLRSLCEENNWRPEDVARVFEERMKMPAKSAPNDDIANFVGLVRGGLIKVGNE